MSEDVLTKAAALIQGGRFADGAALAKRVLEQTPGHPGALQLLASATWKSGDIKRAETFFRQALERAPNFTRAWYELAAMLYQERRLDQAAEYAARVTVLEPRNPAGWGLRASIEQKRKRLSEAIALCREGLKYAPAAARLHYSLGQLLREDCAFTEAAEAYGLALHHGFDAPELYQNRGEALLEAGDADGALACLNAGIERFPDNALLHRLKAGVHREVAAPGDPVADLHEAARRQPQNAALWEVLGDLLNRLDRRVEAREAVAEARALGCPPSAGLGLLEAIADATAGRKADATRRFEQLVRDHPNHAALELAFAAHAMSSGDPSRAEALCAEVLKAHPYSQLAWAYLGTAWRLLGDQRERWLLDYERMVIPIRVQQPADYPDRARFFRALTEALDGLHRTRAHPIDQTLRGGTQTNGYLFRHKQPLIRQLEMQIREAVCTAIATFPRDERHPFWRRTPNRDDPQFRFAGAWSVRLSSTGFHTNHVHPQGWVSSALYVSLPDALPGQEGSIQFGVPPVEMGLAIEPRRVVAPEVGTLLLFPSYMWHGTIPFSAREPRLTVAFDLVPA
jgi:predicted Zn-dependent protease